MDLDVDWIHGSRSLRHPTDPPQQVHVLEPDTVLIRQSKDVTFEAPFILLVMGQDRALLLDTGAVEGDRLRATVDAVLASRTARNGRSYELVVAHTHGHGDHVAGDAAFIGRPGTTVVGRDVDAVRAHFGFADWPRDAVTLDLGGRVLDVLAIPGHHAASIAVHDHRTGLLHTGDTVYPGRIYVEDSDALLESLDRLVAFAEEHGVRHVLGCHVEMTSTPGKDYPLGCRYQPAEPSPFLAPAQLTAARDAFRTVADHPGIHRFDDIVFCIGSGPGVALPLYTRGIVERLRHRVASLR